MDIRANYPTRRAKSSRQAKKVEDKKLFSEQKAKNVIREIEKPKSHTDKKPQVSKAVVSTKHLKQKKIHKCSICLKVFKGIQRSTNEKKLSQINVAMFYRPQRLEKTLADSFR